MADEIDDRRFHARKLGDDVKKFIDEVKLLTDLLPFVVKMAAFIGGALLIGYASKERFFYDLSSISVITLLIITFFSFSFLFILLVGYSFVSMSWISWLFYHTLVSISSINRRGSMVASVVITVFTLLSLILLLIYYNSLNVLWLSLSVLWVILLGYNILIWKYAIDRSAIIIQLRPYITWKWALFSVGLFATMTVSFLAVYLLKREVPWPIVGYLLFTGFLINCVVTTERRPGESKPPGENDRLRVLFGFVGLPIVTLFYFGTLGPLLNSTMTFLNFRSPPDQLLRLNEQAYEKVRDIAAYASVKVRPCQVGKDSWVLRNATLVWHGVGATAYLRILGTGEASLLIPLPNDTVEVLYSTGIQLPQYCAA